VNILLDSIVQAVNDQIGREQTASLSYKGLSMACDRAGFQGAAKYFEKASADEIKHRDMFMKYLTDFDAIAIVPTVSPKPFVYTSLYDTIEGAVELELEVTMAIGTLWYTAFAASDAQTMQMLGWFVDEQTKSLAELRIIEGWFKAYGDKLDTIDHDMGEL